MKLIGKESVSRNDEVAWRIVDGEAVLLSPADARVRGLNPVGTRIWELLDGEKFIQEIAKIISSEFDVELHQAQKDTQEFIKELEEKGLVTTRKNQ